MGTAVAPIRRITCQAMSTVILDTDATRSMSRIRTSGYMISGQELGIKRPLQSIHEQGAYEDGSFACAHGIVVASMG